METIDRAACKSIAADVAEALQAVAEKHGLKVTVGGGSFTSDEFTPKVKFATADAGRTSFAMLAESYGLTPEQYGAEFEYAGNLYTLVGINPRASRFPINARRISDGKMFKMPERAVAFALKMNAVQS